MAKFSLVEEKTYNKKAARGDVELICHQCAECASQGTLVLELQECRSTGKHKTPTLFKVGAWQYPGIALDVVNKIFPTPVEEPADKPPPSHLET